MPRAIRVVFVRKKAKILHKELNSHGIPTFHVNLLAAFLLFDRKHIMQIKKIKSRDLFITLMLPILILQIFFGT